MAYSSAIRREVRWRVTGTDAWSDIATCSPVAELRLEGLDRAKTYDVEVRDISACGAPSTWVLHNAVVPDVAPGNITLSDLSSAASAAQAEATSAINQLTDIASDGKLTALEKIESKQRFTTLTAEQSGIDAQATAYGITTEKTNYDSAITSLKNYLKTTVGVLDASYVWTGTTGTTAITRTTWDSTWTTVYTAKTTLLNAIYAAAKAKADAAQGTANSAQTTATQGVSLASSVPVINGGFDTMPLGYGWTADSGTGWFIDASGQTPGIGPNGARHTGGVGSASGAYRNGGLVACGPGQVYKAQALIKAIAADGACYVMISWCDATGSEIGTKPGNPVTGNGTAGSFAVGSAPAGTVYARTCLAVSSHTSGYYIADNVLCSQYPSNIGEVPDGGGRYAVNQVDGNGLAVVDFSQPGHVNKTQSYIGDDASFRRVAASFTDASNRPIGLYYGGMRTGDYFLARANATGTQPLATISDAGALAGKNSVNLDADVADGTNFRRVGAGYTDGSGRVTKLWNGAAIKSVTDGVFSGDSITRLGGRSLDNISDTTSRFAATEAGADNSKNNVPVSILNPNFEAGSTGWNNAGQGDNGTFVITISGTYKWDGSYSCVRNGNAIGTDVLRNNATIGVGTGELIGASAMIRAQAANGTANVRITWLDASGAGVGTPSEGNTTTGTTGWIVSRIVAPVPSGAAKARVELVVRNSTDTGGSYYFDGCMMWKNPATQDELPNGFTYARIQGTELSSGVHKLGVAGSGYRLGDQRNTPSSLSRAYGAVRSSTALTVYSSGAVDVNAHNLTMGTAQINYNAVSNAVTGLTVGQTYQIYTRDNYAGGSPTWLATQSASTANSFDDAYIGGSITVPSSGSGGGGLPGGGGCVHVDSWLQPGLRAKHVRWWQRLDCAHRGRRYRRWQSWLARVRFEPCVRIVADGGAALVCSIHTPFDLRDGATAFAADMYGHEVLTDHGWRRVIDVIGVGIQPVMRIHVGGHSYAAGEDPANRIYSHNPVK